MFLAFLVFLPIVSRCILAKLFETLAKIILIRVAYPFGNFSITVRAGFQ